MNPQIGDLSEDGYWVLTAEGWQPSEKQIQALNQGASPHTESNSQQVAMVTLTPDVKETQSTIRMKYIFSGAIAFTLVLLLFGMYLDSWTTVDEDAEEIGMKGGIGLTGVTVDCSEVTGTDSETGESNKDLCKFYGGLSTGEFPVSQVLVANTVGELVEDVPNEMSGNLDTMCASYKELNEVLDDSEIADDIGKCEDRLTAGSTAITFFWLSFISALVTLSVVLATANKYEIPYSNEVEKFGILSSAILALFGLALWLVLRPQSSDTGLGSAFYLTLLCIVLLSALAALQFIRPKAVGEVVLFE
tara:strand:+ start:363 stop:1274 length:912 start_codon:yes stop_codon:yes gene_type:complete